MFKAVKPAFFFALFLLACQAGAQVFSMDPERLVSIQLINGETLAGHIVDADAQQLHLVGARVNRLVPFSLLSDSTKKDLNLLSHKPSESAALGEFQGLSSTRSALKESQKELASANRSPSISPAYSYSTSYPIYPAYSYPCFYRTGSFGYSGGIFIRF